MSTLLWTIIVSIIFYVVVRYIYNYRSCYLWTLLSEIKYMMMMMMMIVNDQASYAIVAQRSREPHAGVARCCCDNKIHN